VPPVNEGVFADRLYAALEPYARDDANNNYALLTFLGGLAQMYEPIRVLADDGDNGEVGWSVILDLLRCPTSGLPWLGQLVGAIVDPTLSDADQRAQIQHVSGWARGSLAAIKAAPAPYLTGTKTVIIRERDSGVAPTDPAYGLTILTYTAETPDPTAVLNAILAQKPAGIILNYSTIAGTTYETIYVGNAAYSDIYGTYTTYQGVMDDDPGH
jgi:hypothetical protein